MDINELLRAFVFLVPATYLVTLYVTQEDGPFEVFSRLRQWAGVAEDGIPEYVEELTTDDVPPPVSEAPFWGQVLACHRCTTPYIAAVIMAIGLVTGVVNLGLDLILMWMAVSGLVIFLFER